jgi:hypothetical protein
MQQRYFFGLRKFKQLTSKRSTQHSASITAKIAASGLVLASSGFGAAYAWQTGAHGTLVVGGIPVLACMAVVMALSLEIAKPYAIASCLASFRNWQPVTGAMLAVLGLVAITYSLTAEISLLAMLRSDTAAHRQLAIEVSADETAAAKRAAERYDAARNELAALASSRATGEVRAEIEGLLLVPGSNGCASIDGPVTKRVCPKVLELRAELGRAVRREQLQSAMVSASGAAAVTTRPREAFAVADPGAVALTTYLGELGFVVQPGIIAQWLVLIPVLALEVGSALAGILAGSLVSEGSSQALSTSIAHACTRRTKSVSGAKAPSLTADAALDSGVTDTGSLANTRMGGPVSQEAGLPVHSCEIVPLGPVRGTSRDEAARRIMAALRARGGKIDASLRTMAADLAVSVGTLRGAIAALATAGKIISRPTSSGTTICLAA